MMDVKSFIAGLPKAELHIHIEGSLEPEMMFDLAERNNVALPFADVPALRAAYRFSNLQEFLDLYYQGAAVLLIRADFHDLGHDYLRRAAADNVRHAEIFFDPQTHTSRGIPMREVIEGLLDSFDEARSVHGVTSRLILCFLRHLNEEDAFDTLRAAEPWLDRIAGVGLDSSELGHPPEKFTRVFAAAGALRLKRVAHGGEDGPPSYVSGALDALAIDRLDHGNRALEDPDLVQRLVQDAMTLTVCPLSNLRLKVVQSMDSHPIAEMLRAGLRATVNSDDPAYFGGYINDNYLAVASLLDRSDLVRLARNSFPGSFLDPTDIHRHLTEVDAWAARA